MVNAAQIKEITNKIAEFLTAADEQENKELNKFHGWMKDFKPSVYLKGLRKQAADLEKQLKKMAVKVGATEWDAVVNAANIAPECYSYEALTEY